MLFDLLHTKSVSVEYQLDSPISPSKISSNKEEISWFQLAYFAPISITQSLSSFPHINISCSWDFTVCASTSFVSQCFPFSGDSLHHEDFFVMN